MHNLINFPKHLLLNQAREARVQISKLEDHIREMERNIADAKQQIAEEMARETACNEAAEKVSA